MGSVEMGRTGQRQRETIPLDLRKGSQVYYQSKYDIGDYRPVPVSLANQLSPTARSRLALATA